MHFALCLMHFALCLMHFALAMGPQKMLVGEPSFIYKKNFLFSENFKLNWSSTH